MSLGARVQMQSTAYRLVSREKKQALIAAAAVAAGCGGGDRE